MAKELDQILGLQDFSEFSPGQVLEQADLGSYIASMGLGIAAAQTALDNNSVNQLVNFTEPVPSLGGKSLFHAGLIPAFYSFRSATISCSVSMSLQVTEGLDVGFELSADSEGEVTKRNTRGSRIVKANDRDIVFSSDKIRTSSSTGMNAVYDYSEQNNTSDDYVLLATKSEVKARNDFAAQGLATYDSETSLIAVAPQGVRWKVIRISNSNANATFKILHGDQTGFAVSGNLENKVDSILQAVASKGNISAYVLGGTYNDLTEILFDHDSYAVKEVGGVNYSQRIRGLSKIILAHDDPSTTDIERLLIESIDGHTDETGPTTYNEDLSNERAASVASALRANGISTNGVELNGLGEAGATGGNNLSERWARIDVDLPEDTYFIYLEEEAPGGLRVSSSEPFGFSVDNGVMAEGSFDGEAKITDPQDSETVLFAAQDAASLASEMSNSSSVEATAVGEFVHLTNKSSGDLAVVEVYARDESAGFEHDTTNLVLDGTSSKSRADVKRKEKNVNKTRAFAASISARYARQFDMSMSGNMSVSAELVSLPAPPEFLQLIKEYLEE